MKHLKTIIGIAALCALFSCAKSQTDGCGQVVFEVAGNHEVADVTKSSVSDYTTLPSAAEFTIDIKDASGSLVWVGKISEWNPTTVLQAGKYTVEATYGALEAEGFDKPYFCGSQSFTIVAEQSTAVSVPVALANTIIRISCSDNFKNYYKNYEFKLTRDGTDVVTFAKDETRAAFIDGYKIKVEGTLTTEVKTQTFSKEYTNLNEATAYTLAFDASNVGGSTITITFNDVVEEVDLGNFELND
jgi:hypothetical protein